MDSANTAFLADEYAAAEQALNEVLNSQPDNGTAQELLRVVQKARHGAAARATRLEYRNEWQDTFDELTQEAVIPNDLITFPDTQAWKTIVERGNKSFGAGGTTGPLAAGRGREAAAGEGHPRQLPGRAAGRHPHAPAGGHRRQLHHVAGRA
jgi:hypothetical protein